MLKLNKDVVKDLFPNINKKRFQLEAEMKPSGDQINAIEELCTGLKNQESNQVLLGGLVQEKPSQSQMLLILFKNPL